MAVGATRSQVHGLFLRHTAMILFAGLVPGIVLTELSARAARSLLYGVKETDLLALSLSVGVLCLSGFLATLVPASRAAAVDPVKALRAE
jgi:ABC-type antimicrobial peptide transport system permease subunit